MPNPGKAPTILERDQVLLTQSGSQNYPLEGDNAASVLLVRIRPPPECDRRKPVVRKRLLHTPLYPPRRGTQPHLFQLLYNFLCFCPRSFLVLRSVDSLQHQTHLLHLPPRHVTEHVPIEMNNAALPQSFRIKISQTLHQTQTRVAYEHLYPTKPPGLEMTQRGVLYVPTQPCLL